MFYFENLKYLFEPLPPLVTTRLVLERAKANRLIADLREQLVGLIAREEELLGRLTGVSHPRKAFWDEKHRETVITYNARNIPYTNTRITMDVRQFLVGDITTRRWALRNSDLKCTNPLQYDSLIREFYLRDREDFLYAYDEDSNDEGTAEVWLYPYELDSAGRGDCEDHAHRMKARLNALGLPDWRSRVVCGLARSGEGHSTTYYLADDLATWVHLNSTTEKMAIPASLPTINDESDVMGISDVWFSFNKEKAWANFEKPSSGTERFKYVDVLL